MLRTMSDGWEYEYLWGKVTKACVTPISADKDLQIRSSFTLSNYHRIIRSSSAPDKNH